MSLFTEADLEQATLEWFIELGFATLNGTDIAPDAQYSERKTYTDVVLLERLASALQNLNPHLPPDALEDAVRQIAIPKHTSLIVNNQAFHKLITDGVDVALRDADGAIRYDKARVFDFEQPANNDWLVVNQFTVIEGKAEKRPDMVFFVNGLLLVVIELKSSSLRKCSGWN